MCAGAIINSRVSHLIFGAYDEEKGCCGSLYQLCGDRRLDSRTTVQGGIEEKNCTAILKDFFQLKRNKGTQ
jgi:tRNA(adenine34) deaminase